MGPIEHTEQKIESLNARLKEHERKLEIERQTVWNIKVHLREQFQLLDKLAKFKGLT